VVTPNVPNVLTMLRILLVPVLLVALLDKSPSRDLLAAIVFAVASFPTRSTATWPVRATP
jgi:phosphatidylglycerophosphate synthase